MRLPPLVTHSILATILSLGAACGGAATTPAQTPVSGQAGPLPSDMIEWPAALAAPSTPASHRQAIDELFEAMDAKGLYDSAIEIAIQQQLSINAQIREFEDVIHDFLSRYMSFDSLREDLVQLYVNSFTELEVRQLVAFYQTDVGKTALQKMPILMAEGGKIGQTRVEAHRDELMAAVAQAMAAKNPTP